MTIGSNLTETEIAASFKRGNLYSWAEVSRIHRVRMGIYQKNERLISLLTDFGRINPCYPDQLDADGKRILYTGNGRRGDQPLSPANRALLAAIETKHAVPLFNKLAIGQWRFEGFWRVESGEYVFDETRERMIWQFMLCRSLVLNL
ncbi:MAG: hypothetical protein ABI954_15985 [Pyrinomonadaceae bacterium]